MRGALLQTGANPKDVHCIKYFDTKSGRLLSSVAFSRDVRKFNCLERDWVIISRDLHVPASPDNTWPHVIEVWERNGDTWHFSFPLEKFMPNCDISFVGRHDEKTILIAGHRKPPPRKLPLTPTPDDFGVKGEPVLSEDIISVDVASQHITGKTLHVGHSIDTLGLSEGGDFIVVDDGEVIEVYNTRNLSLLGRCKAAASLFHVPRRLRSLRMDVYWRTRRDRLLKSAISKPTATYSGDEWHSKKLAGVNFSELDR